MEPLPPSVARCLRSDLAAVPGLADQFRAAAIQAFEVTYELAFSVMASRVSGRAKPFSDLDLVVMGEEPLPLATLADLRDDFDGADLPRSVDITEWASASDGFRRIIAAQAHPFRLAANT
jgi:predicted nucleotidyltransferase